MAAFLQPLAGIRLRRPVQGRWPPEGWGRGLGRRFRLSHLIMGFERIGYCPAGHVARIMQRPAYPHLMADRFSLSASAFDRCFRLPDATTVCFAFSLNSQVSTRDVISMGINKKLIPSLENPFQAPETKEDRKSVV